MRGAIAAALALATALAAKPERTVSRHTELSVHGDAGWCRAIVDVTPSGCVVSTTRDDGAGPRSDSEHIRCALDLDACGEVMRCDCTQARAHARTPEYGPRCQETRIPDGGSVRVCLPAVFGGSSPYELDNDRVGDFPRLGVP